MNGGGVEFRVFQIGDEAAINDCYNRAYGTDQTDEGWALRFRATGSPRAIVVAIRDGKVLAMVAGVANRLRVGSTVLDALVVVDAFAVAGRAAENEQRSLFDRALDAFVDLYGRSGDFPLIFFSAAVASRSFIALPCEESPALPTVTTLFREKSKRPAPRRLFYRAEAGRDWEPRLDDLWNRAQCSYDPSIVRDADHALRYFAGNPGAKFHRFIILPRFSSRAVAHAVFDLVGDCCGWVDLVWDHRHPGALDLLGHISSRLAAQAGLDCERVILGGDEGGVARLRALGFGIESRSDDLSLEILFRDPKRVPRSFPEGHYLTAADLEII